MSMKSLVVAATLALGSCAAAPAMAQAPACKHTPTEVAQLAAAQDLMVARFEDRVSVNAFLKALVEIPDYPPEAPRTFEYDYLQVVPVADHGAVLVFIIKDNCVSGSFVLPIMVFQQLIREAHN